MLKNYSGAKLHDLCCRRQQEEVEVDPHCAVLNVLCSDVSINSPVVGLLLAKSLLIALRPNK